MIVLDEVRAARMLCAAVGRPGMYVFFPLFPGQDPGDVIKAAPYLEGHLQALCDGRATILCDSEEERDALYAQTVGKDGSVVNGYVGPVRVYALTINADGTTESENT